ncbi:sigma factor-like helix-turn-helix DNA-binding protein [Actinoplanes sp. G11-F43]|uniref:sigma factor-like helix-turn-helix DNA-binding protein n=1 Tax=Actinoplanes sp. G11-F43 TaxID=3424130 RepID=UPI003D3331E6
MTGSLSMAFLVLLETLSPVERAVFMLREVFGYGYPEVAAFVGRPEANRRRIRSRARQRMTASESRFGSFTGPSVGGRRVGRALRRGRRRR